MNDAPPATPTKRRSRWWCAVLPVLVVGGLVLAWASGFTEAPPAPHAQLPNTTPIRSVGQVDGWRTLAWDELVPADWRPGTGFEPVDLATMRDGDARTQVLMQRMRQAWDSAPANPAVAGPRIRLLGYVVPLEASPEGVSEFLLVPYFGACVHTPPPPANQIVHVRAAQPVPGLRSMHTVWVHGQLRAERITSAEGVSAYRIDASEVHRQHQSWKWN